MKFKLLEDKQVNIYKDANGKSDRFTEICKPTKK